MRQCTPCREGTYWLVQLMERLEAGRGDDGDLDKLLDITDSIVGKAFCALGDAAGAPITSSLALFRDEYLEHAPGALPVRSGRVGDLRGAQ